MTELLKMEFGWGTLKASDIVDYVPIVISVDDYKYITGQDYQATKEPDEATEPNEAKEPDVAKEPNEAKES